VNKLDQFFEKATTPANYAKDYNQYLVSILSAIEGDAFNDYIQLLLDVAKAGKTIYIIGNGGSAATASHYANDISFGVKSLSCGLKAISLTDNNAVLTALGNDYGYEHIFSKQLEKIMVEGDILIAISASGNSGNIVKALELVKSIGNKVVGISGFDGGYLAEHSDVSLLVNSNKGEYGPVEDAHSIIGHITGTYLARYFPGE
jgi:D-sedoheptulose 7-phosphate isomerase